jgi:hypothetical protein
VTATTASRATRRHGVCRKHASRRAANAQPTALPAQRVLVLVSVEIRSPRAGTRVGLSIFLSVDPVPGGSANAYDYCNQDPVNCSDLGGKIPGIYYTSVFFGVTAPYQSPVSGAWQFFNYFTVNTTIPVKYSITLNFQVLTLSCWVTLSKTTISGFATPEEQNPFPNEDLFTFPYMAAPGTAPYQYKVVDSGTISAEGVTLDVGPVTQYYKCDSTTCSAINGQLGQH